MKSASRYSFQFNERARPARLKPVAFCLKGRCSIYTHVISEDGRRIAAQLGKAVWGVLDPSWTLKENSSGVESPKPLYLN